MKESLSASGACQAKGDASRTCVSSVRIPGEAVMDSVIFVAPSRSARRDAQIARLREAGLLPVAVPTVDAAVTLLRQFSVAAAVVHTDASPAEGTECRRLIATGTPVVFVASHESAEAVRTSLTAGCAAVVCEPFTAREFAAVIHRIKAGERGVTQLPHGGTHPAVKAEKAPGV
jgi:DNA-binding response OmpR family regulator